MQFLTVLISVVLVSAFIGMVVLMFSSKKHAAVKQGTSWLLRNGFEIVDCQYRGLFIGLPLGAASGAQGVLRIRAIDADGRMRTGWLVLGSPLIGMWDPSVKVIWDEDEATPVG